MDLATPERGEVFGVLDRRVETGPDSPKMWPGGSRGHGNGKLKLSWAALKLDPQVWIPPADCSGSRDGACRPRLGARRRGG